MRERGRREEEEGEGRERVRERGRREEEEGEGKREEKPKAALSQVLENKIVR